MSAVVTVAVIFFVYQSTHGTSSPDNFPWPPAPVEQVIADWVNDVKAANYTYYTFGVPAGATGISINGHFIVTGDTGNDIVCLILDEDGFTTSGTDIRPTLPSTAARSPRQRSDQRISCRENTTSCSTTVFRCSRGRWFRYRLSRSPLQRSFLNSHKLGMFLAFTV